MRTYKLKELLSIKNGKDHKALKNGTIPIFGSGGIMRFGDKAIYNDESILLPRKGTLSNIQYVNKPFWTVDTIYYSIVNKGLANPFYLYNFIKSLDLSKLNTGTGVPSMTFDSYYNLNIVLPELEVQQKIASLLSALDSKIELNNRINTELEAMAKTLYDYWFVQFEFPIEAATAAKMGYPELVGKPYKTSGGKMVWNETLKREIPEGWEVSTVEKYADVKKGDLITSKGAKIGSIKVIAAGIDFSYLHSTPNRMKNTITISGSGANAGFINFWREPIFASDCITVRGKSDAETLMLLQYLKIIQPHILNQATGSAQPHVYPSDIKVLNYLEPINILIEKYGELVIPMNERIGLNLQENQKLTELRDWLLPMLMNGQVKVG